MKLATRTIAIGAVQIVVLAAAALAIATLAGPEREPRAHELVDPRRIEALLDRRDELQAEIAALRTQHVQVSLYDREGHLIATNVDPPLALPPRPTMPRDDERPRRPSRPPDGFDPALVLPYPSGGIGSPRPGMGWPILQGEIPLIAPLSSRGERFMLIARGELPPPPGWTGPILILVIGVLVLVVGPLLAARWIVRPIARVTRTARALGGGELHARSGVASKDEVGELGCCIDEMADRIETLIQAEKELFANVAHELRTPLARISVALDLAASGDALAARDSLGEIAADLGELESIVDDILSTIRFDLARGKEAEAAQIPLRQQLIAPRSLVDAAIQRQRVRNPTREILVDTSEDLGDVHVDPMLMRRVLDNLLENAHKYTPDAAAPTTVRVRSLDHHLVFDVIDRGSGIPAEDTVRVFMPFFRSERSRSRETGGVGLGLTLAKRIVEGHGGTIEVTSRVGEGTMVRVTLPEHEVHEPAADVVTTSEPERVDDRAGDNPGRSAPRAL